LTGYLLLLLLGKMCTGRILDQQMAAAAAQTAHAALIAQSG
jgi:hypothetical protein